MVWEVMFMKKDTMPAEKKDNTYTVEIDKNVFHVISKFQGTETAGKIIYDLAVKRILYEDTAII